MKEFMWFRLAALLAVLSLLAGCAVEPSSQAMVDAFRLIRAESSPDLAVTGLNPKYRYLRVQIDERAIFMVLGYIDQTPNGPVEVWYSSESDVLRLRDGRVVGANIKRGVNWLSVYFTNFPSWNMVGEQAEFERIRDESPGYRYGIKERLLIHPIPPPGDTNLQLVSTKSLTWFEEIVRGDEVIRPARYALSQDGENRVIYGEQCLSSAYCFSWQTWAPISRGSH
jgi:hypothetical protein